jgi:RNA polymerase sigma-70 factor (ECF subfamily)
MTKILVVDDEAAVTDGLTMLFELEAFEAVGAYDREGAEREIALEYYPVVLADFRLKTEEEGLLLLDAIRRLSPRSRIASLTAFATPELESELRSRGSSVVLRKPMEFAEILAAVTELVAAIEAEAAAQTDGSGEALDLEALYAEVRMKLFAIPQRRYGLTAEETDELVQEAWLLFLSKRASVRAPAPWLAGTVVNLARQVIQRRVRHGETSIEDPESGELRAEVVSESPALESLIVRQALARVDARTRSLCVMIGMEGRSYEEVAEALELPIGSVGPLYIRAKNRMRRVMNEGN